MLISIESSLDIDYFGSQMTNLQDQIAEAEWAWLCPHLQRDAIIFVGASVNLMTVATAVAQDSANQVQVWIQAALIGKPTQAQIDTWNQTPAKKFRTLVIQPYVLIQEQTLH